MSMIGGDSGTSSGFYTGFYSCILPKVKIAFLH